MPLRAGHSESTPVLDLFSLKGKIAIVTGGGRGIGLQIARAYAEAGADVAIIYRTTQDAVKRAEEISAACEVRVRAFQADVRSREDITTSIEHICSDFGHGRVDIVVANAGVCAEVPALDYTEEQWQWNNSVNYDGVMWTAQAAGRIFKKQGFGNLVVTASVSSTVCNIPQTQACYNSSKAAAAHLTRCLAVEWKDFARVNCVSPGYVNTLSKCSSTMCSIDVLKGSSGIIAGSRAHELVALTSSCPPCCAAMGIERGTHISIPP
jgi:sorbose reductase